MSIQKLSNDETVKDRKGDRFKVYPVVRTLLDIIDFIVRDKDLEGSLNIGLFGKWGVGKTSIIDILKDELENNDTLSELRSSVKIVYFDVWKYAYDDIRIQLLIYLDKKLETNLGIKADIDERTKTVYTEPKKNWRYFIRIIPYILIYIAILFIATWFGLLTPLNLSTDTTTNVTIVSIGIFVISLIVWEIIKTFTSKLYSETEIEEIKLPLKRADHFQDKFIGIIDKYIKKNDNIAKLIFVFDNIDRCEKEVVAKTLNLIKTFLGIERCVFIVPADEEAIKKHLTKSGYSRNEANEYLEKFFQLNLRIPYLIPDDIGKYIGELCSESGFEPEIAEIIELGYAKTPRKVKVYLNNLTVLRQVAINKDSEGAIQKGLADSIIPTIAFLEIIRDNWPDGYARLLIDPNYISYIRDNLYLPNEPTEPWFDEDFRNFIIGTRSVNTDNIDEAINICSPEYELELDDTLELKNAILAGNISYLQSYLKDATPENRKVENVVKVIISSLRVNVRLSKKLLANNIISIATGMFDDLSKDISLANAVSDAFIHREYIDGITDVDKLGRYLRILVFAKSTKSDRPLSNLIESKFREEPLALEGIKRILKVIGNNLDRLSKGKPTFLNTLKNELESCDFGDSIFELMDHISRFDGRLFEIAPMKLWDDLISTRNYFEPVVYNLIGNNADAIDITFHKDLLLRIKTDIDGMAPNAPGEFHNVIDAVTAIRFPYSKELRDLLVSLNNLIDKFGNQDQRLKIVKAVFTHFGNLSTEDQDVIKDNILNVIVNHGQSLTELAYTLKVDNVYDDDITHAILDNLITYGEKETIQEVILYADKGGFSPENLSYVYNSKIDEPNNRLIAIDTYQDNKDKMTKEDREDFLKKLSANCLPGKTIDTCALLEEEITAGFTNSEFNLTHSERLLRELARTNDAGLSKHLLEHLSIIREHIPVEIRQQIVISAIKKIDIKDLETFKKGYPILDILTAFSDDILEDKVDDLIDNVLQAINSDEIEPDNQERVVNALIELGRIPDSRASHVLSKIESLLETKKEVITLSYRDTLIQLLNLVPRRKQRRGKIRKALKDLFPEDK